MSHIIKIAGKEIALEWTQETAKRLAFRLGLAGGMPTARQFLSRSTAPMAIAKIVWGLLPKNDFTKYETPEDLYVDIDQETEGLVIAEAVNSIFSEMNPSTEKKSTTKK